MMQAHRTLGSRMSARKRASNTTSGHTSVIASPSIHFGLTLVCRRQAAHAPRDDPGPCTACPKRQCAGGCIDSQTGMLPGMPGSARCVQRFDDSRNSAIHITYRISLRSSSLREPRDPLSKVVFSLSSNVHGACAPTATRGNVR